MNTAATPKPISTTAATRPPISNILRIVLASQAGRSAPVGHSRTESHRPAPRRHPSGTAGRLRHRHVGGAETPQGTCARSASRPGAGLSGGSVGPRLREHEVVPSALPADVHEGAPRCDEAGAGGAVHLHARDDGHVG